MARSTYPLNFIRLMIIVANLICSIWASRTAWVAQLIQEGQSICSIRTILKKTHGWQFVEIRCPDWYGRGHSIIRWEWALLHPPYINLIYNIYFYKYCVLVQFQNHNWVNKLIICILDFNVGLFHPGTELRS